MPNNPKSISRHLRKEATPAETILWEEIRNRKLGGLKFIVTANLTPSKDFQKKAFRLIR